MKTKQHQKIIVYTLLKHFSGGALLPYVYKTAAVSDNGVPGDVKVTLSVHAHSYSSLSPSVIVSVTPVTFS